MSDLLSATPFDDDAVRERRSETRHTPVRWSARLFAAGTDEPCFVRSLAETGLVAQVLTPRGNGDQVRIELVGGQQLAGEVVETERGIVALRLAEPIDVVALIRAQGDAEERADDEIAEEPLCQGLLQAGDDMHVVEVRDLSQGGARLATRNPLAPQQPVFLCIDGLAPIDGRVRWSEGGCAGIAFPKPIPFDLLAGWTDRRTAPADPHTLARRWPRHHIFFRTWLTLSDMSNPVEAIVHNLSRGGLSATCRRGLHRGETVTISLGRIGEVPSRVAWVDDDRAGFAFTRTIDTDEVLRPFASGSVAPLIKHHVAGRRPGLKMH